MATSPIYGWAEPDNTDLVKNGALAIRTLGNAIDTTMGTMTPKSTVTAKGSLVAATAASTPANLSVGANGTSLVADSSQSTGLAWVATPSASNPVINAAMQVAQRGTSINVGASVPTHCLDRWMLSPSTNTFTVAQQATSDTTNLPSIQFCSRVQRTAGQTGTNIAYYAQSFETINSRPFAGKTVTMSFYARAGANYSAASSVLGAFLVSGTGTDQNVLISYTGSATVATSNVTLTTTWQRFTITGNVGATATELATYFGFTPVGTAGANDYYEVTGVQVDIGSVALPFRTAGVSYQQELALCQRYYQRFVAGATNGNFGQGWSISATSALAFVNSKVTLRIIPTAIETGGGIQIQQTNNSQYSVSSITIDTSRTNQNVFAFSGTTSGATAGLSFQIQGSSDANAYVGFSGEL